jgi:hypothetical protein
LAPLYRLPQPSAGGKGRRRSSRDLGRVTTPARQRRQALVGNTGYRRYLNTIRDDVDLDKIEEDKKFDGIFVLRTNTGLNPLKAISATSNFGPLNTRFESPSTCSRPGRSSTNSMKLPRPRIL